MAKVLEEAEAIGGMRNPRRALERLPESGVLGEVVGEFLDSALESYPELTRTAEDILSRSAEITPLGTPEVIGKIRKSLMTILQHSQPLPPRTAKATTPLQAEVLWGWARHSDDPDAATLAMWLRQGAPLEYTEPIPLNGVFPPSTGTPADAPTEAELLRSHEGWTNWPSADEEAKPKLEVSAEWWSRPPRWSVS